MATSPSRGPDRRLVAVAAALALLIAWQGLPIHDAPPAGDPHAPLRPASTVELVDAASSTAGRAAETLSPIAVEDEPPVADLSLPHRFTLQLRVEDRYGLPVEGAWLFVAPPECAFARCGEPTDARGRLQFACRGRQRQQALWIAVMAYGSVEPARRIELVDGAPLQLVVTARGRSSEPTELIELLDRGYGPEHLAAAAKMARREHRSAGRFDRRDPGDVLCGRSIFLFREVPCLGCHEPGRVAGYLPLQWAPSMVPSLHPEAVFRDLAVEPPDAAQQQQQNAELPADQQRRRRHPSGPGPMGPGGSLRGTVRGADGAQIAGMPVVWLTGDGVVRQRAETDAEGRYRLALPFGGACSVVAAGGALGRDEALAAVDLGATSDQDFVLRRERQLRGRASDERGQPLAGWTVLFVGQDESGGGIATTDGDGAFTLSHLPRNGRCHLFAPDADLRLPVLSSDVHSVDSGDVELRLRAPARARLRLHPRLPPSHPHARVEVRLHQHDTGFAAHIQPQGFDDAFDLEGLAAGDYSGELGAAGLGWVAFGPVYLDGRGLWDLGAVVLPPPGRVRFELSGDARSPLQGDAVFVHHRADTDAITMPRLRGEAAELPAGDYTLLWQDHGRLRGRTVTVRAGEDCVVPIAR